jgi:hypothetical protein
MIKLKDILKEETWKAEKSVITLDGEKVGDYSYDRDSDSFWMDNIKGSGQKSFETTGQMLAYIKAHKADYLKARHAYVKKGYVKEVKYPTNLYVGSVILGIGFTGLKGIEGGKYYKVVEMDDTTATLVPSDTYGRVKGSKKVRHKLSSIEGGIKTANRGDENGIESVN